MAPPELPATVRTMFAEHGEMPHQHPDVLAARLALVTGEEHVVYAWPAKRPRCVLALRRNGDIWQSVFPGSPVLTDGTMDGPTFVDQCRHIVRELGADVLYFPLAYPHTVAARLLAAVPGVAEWSRSPSPIVDWSDRGAGIVARFRERHGAQADRKLQRWDQRLTAAVLDPVAACQALTRIERRSWKATAGLDLGSAGQLDYYEHLLRTGFATLTAALQEGAPVAYRIDLRHGRTVYAVEWSFVHDAASSAPGMFLLTAGLGCSWAHAALDHVDLFGAPDILKGLVETGRRDRVDFAWPAGDAVTRLRIERQEHDARLRGQLARRVGIRRMYTGETDQRLAAATLTSRA